METSWIVVGLVAALMYAMPALTRPDIYFATTTATDFRGTPEGLRILRGYRAQIVVHGVIALAFASGRLVPVADGFPVAIAWLLGGSFLAFLVARRAAAPHAMPPTMERDIALVPRDHALPGGWPGQLGPFVLAAVTCAVLGVRWTTLPDRFPIHWGLNGEPDRWVAKTPEAVYGQVLAVAAACGVLLFFALLLQYGSRRVRTDEAGSARERRFRRILLTLVLACEYVIAMTLGGVGVLVSYGVPPHPWLLALPVLVVVAGFTTVLARMGQGGARGASEPAAAAGPIGDRTEDRYWIAGVLYVNPNDPAILVERRFGIGYTLNLGHPLAWLVVVVAIGMIAFSFLRRHHW